MKERMNPPDILTDPGAPTHLNTSGEKAFVCIANRVTEVGMFAGTKSPIATDMIQVAGLSFQSLLHGPGIRGKRSSGLFTFPFSPVSPLSSIYPFYFQKGNRRHGVCELRVNSMLAARLI